MRSLGIGKTRLPKPNTVLLALTTLALTSTASTAQTTGDVAASAFGASVGTPLAALSPTPLAVLPAGGGMGDAEAASVNVPGTLQASSLSSAATGVVGENAASAQSVAGLSDVSILNGVIKARAVVAIASSASNGVTATNLGAGSTIVDLIVNGQSMGVVTPAPNTRIDIPSVGTLILNEQFPSGDGARSAGLTVNAIHLLLRDALTGATTGNIIVGSAQSAGSFAR
jgi:hypothetical protein